MSRIPDSNPATATATAGPQGSDTPAPLVITNVQVINVRRDASRPNGAIATVQISFTGGTGPFSFFDEGAAKPAQAHPPAARRMKM